jgi:hypothetical protein
MRHRVLKAVVVLSCVGALLLLAPRALSQSESKDVRVHDRYLSSYRELSIRERKCQACFAAWALCHEDASDVAAEGAAQACTTWLEHCGNGQDTCEGAR